MSKNENDNQSIDKLIKDSVIEIADHAINLASDNEVLNEIPLIKYISSLNKLKDVYKARKMHKNVMSFLGALSENKEEIVIAEKNIDEFLDTLSLILIDSEKIIKAKIVGNLTEALAKREINFTEFNDLCLIIYSASIPAINLLSLCANEKMMPYIHKYFESHCIDPNMCMPIDGTIVHIDLLASIGVLGIGQNGNQLNCYGMALIKFGKMLPKEFTFDDGTKWNGLSE